MAKEEIELIKKAEREAEDIIKSSKISAEDDIEKARALALKEIDAQRDNAQKLIASAKKKFQTQKIKAIEENEPEISKKCLARREKILSKKEVIIERIIQAVRE